MVKAKEKEKNGVGDQATALWWSMKVPFFFLRVGHRFGSKVSGCQQREKRDKLPIHSFHTVE